MLTTGWESWLAGLGLIRSKAAQVASSAATRLCVTCRDQLAATRLCVTCRDQLAATRLCDEELVLLVLRELVLLVLKDLVLLVMMGSGTVGDDGNWYCW